MADARVLKNKKMKDFWNARYGEEVYAYGTAPNVFFSSEFKKILPGKALFPAEGEGRNAVFAACCGWEVVAFDQSDAGRTKALQLAAAKGVEIDYIVTSVTDFDAKEETFDALVLVYAHFPEPVRKIFHQKLARMLKAGGYLVLEGFSTEPAGVVADSKPIKPHKVKSVTLASIDVVEMLETL